MERYLNSALTPLKKSAIREFSRLAKETPGCVALTLGEPDQDTPEAVRERACLSINSGETHYIENSGLRALREKIARFENEQNGMDYSADEIIVTAGATQALFLALYGIIEPGDEIIIPTPAFGLYEEIVLLSRGVPVMLDTTQDGFQIRRDKLEACLSEKTKGIILNTPNNPTGCVLDRESLEAVHDAALGKAMFVICDDVYRQLVYTKDYSSFTAFKDLRDRILLVQSYSKPYAMTGWRMGYLAGPLAVMDRLALLHQFTLVSTPAPFQKACIEALDCDISDMLSLYRRRRDYMLARLKEIGLPYFEPQGAFYAFPSIAEFGIPSGDFCRRMIKEAGLAATPGYCFGAEGYIRLTYCYSDEALREGLDRLAAFVKKLRKEAANEI